MLNGLGLLLLVTATASPATAQAEPSDAIVDEVVDGAEPEPIAEPRNDALEHLERAQANEAAGMLEAAEAEASTAIALQPDDAPGYLIRAQIRMALADQAQAARAQDAAATRRARATLLRLAADDVAAYVEFAELPSDGEAWFESRREALLRDAEALDPVALPPVEPEPEPEPEPELTIPSPPPSTHDRDSSRRTAAWVSTGAVASAAAVGLAAASLHIEQRCGLDGLCGVRWQAQPSLLAPAITLTALGTSAIVIGLAKAPALDRPRPRRALIGSTLALGSAAAVLGTITAGLVGARWSAPASPSDDASLGTTQALGNTSAASFAAALPLVSGGLTAWIRGRLHRSSSTRMAYHGGR